MTKLAPEWVRTSDPVIRSPARYRWTTAPALPPTCWIHWETSHWNNFVDLYISTQELWFLELHPLATVCNNFRHFIYVTLFIPVSSDFIVVNMDLCLYTMRVYFESKINTFWFYVSRVGIILINYNLSLCVLTYTVDAIMGNPGNNNNITEAGFICISRARGPYLAYITNICTGTRCWSRIANWYDFLTWNRNFKIMAYTKRLFLFPYWVGYGIKNDNYLLY